MRSAPTPCAIFSQILVVEIGQRGACLRHWHNRRHSVIVFRLERHRPATVFICSLMQDLSKLDSDKVRSLWF